MAGFIEEQEEQEEERTEEKIINEGAVHNICWFIKREILSY